MIYIAPLFLFLTLTSGQSATLALAGVLEASLILETFVMGEIETETTTVTVTATARGTMTGTGNASAIGTMTGVTGGMTVLIQDDHTSAIDRGVQDVRTRKEKGGGPHLLAPRGGRRGHLGGQGLLKEGEKIMDIESLVRLRQLNPRSFLWYQCEAA